MRETRRRGNNLTIPEKVFLIRTYYENRGDINYVHRAFEQEFHTETTKLFLKVIQKLVKLFEETASVAQEFPVASDVVVRKHVLPQPKSEDLKIESQSVVDPIKFDPVKRTIEEQLDEKENDSDREEEATVNEFEEEEIVAECLEEASKRTKRVRKRKRVTEEREKGSEQKTVVCPVCGITCKNVRGYETHKIKHLPVSEDHQCTTCDRLFKTDVARKSHEKSHLLPEERPIGEIICSICGKLFHKSTLRKHLQVMHPVGPVEPINCEICGKQFRSKHGFKVHYTNVHSGIHRPREHKCKQCPKEFLTVSGLLFHTRTHTGERPFKCHFCGQGFIDKSTMTVHYRQHTGESPYVCQFCGKTCKQGQNLRSHIRHMHKEEAARTEVKIVKQT